MNMLKITLKYAHVDVVLSAQELPTLVFAIESKLLCFVLVKLYTTILYLNICILCRCTKCEKSIKTIVANVGRTHRTHIATKLSKAI